MQRVVLVTGECILVATNYFHFPLCLVCVWCVCVVCVCVCVVCVWCVVCVCLRAPSHSVYVSGMV